MQRFIFLFLCVIYITPVFSAASIEDLTALIDQNQFAKAAQTGEQLLTNNPDHAKIQFLTAYAYQMNQQHAKASNLYQNLIRQQPNLPEPRNNLAMIYMARGDYERASELLIEAIYTHNSYATAYRNLNNIYKSIASEAYRRALSESVEPEQYAYNIELSALRELDSIDGSSAIEGLLSNESLIQTANIETLLIEQVKNWAKAWSGKDMTTYINYYFADHKPNFESHRAWVEYRKRRIMRPGYIKVSVSDIKIRAQSKNRAIIDFNQMFDSPNYSDRVVKRLDFTRIGSQWKISHERVLSVL